MSIYVIASFVTSISAIFFLISFLIRRLLLSTPRLLS